MTSFIRKEVASRPSVGPRLRERREQLEKSLAEAAAQTQIRPQYLESLEAGDFSHLPGEVYAKSFLKVYAEYLGLPAAELLRQYATERSLFKKTGTDVPAERTRPVARADWLHLLWVPKIIRIASVGALGLAIVIYLGAKVQGIISPPLLIVSTPAQDFVTRDAVVRVSGQTEAEASLAINGQPVVADATGRFEETFDLKPGINTIEVLAQKKHSQPAVIERQVVVVEDAE